VLVGDVIDPAAEPDGVLDLVPPHLPRIAAAQPAIGPLDLPAVADVLIEDAELVAEAVTDRGEIERGERIHVASREAPETAVAEPRFFLVLDQIGEVDTLRGERGLRRLLESEREQARAELRADQVLGRQVDHAAVPARVVRARRVDPPEQQPIADRVREREVVVVARRHIRELRQLEEQLLDDVLP
jgi:hypothetical protein